MLGQEAEFVWHKETDLGGADAVILPGGFAHGDYLRTGAIARFSPVMTAVQAFADRGGPVIGICNGFQMLLEAGLLPGAMLRNMDSSTAASTCTSASSRPTRRSRRCCRRGRSCGSRSPRRGQLLAPTRRLGELERNRQVIFRYTTPRARSTDAANPERIARATSPASATSRATWSA